jgi:hypothetical protein
MQGKYGFLKMESQTITTGLQPDWIWIKVRSLTGYHNITDTSRGVTRELYMNTADDEENNGRIASSSTTGFTFPDSAYGYTNEGGQTFVSWNWHANGGSTSSNSEGTTTSTVQANTTAGFSIVTYAGNSSSRTVGHGLDSAPEWVIVKSRTDAERWAVFHTSISTKYIYLNETFAGSTSNADERFGDSSSVVVPSSTVVTLGANNSDVNENGDDYVMYCFHSVAGYSKFGKYVATGSGGEFVYLGFRPAMIIFKCDAASTQWLIFDSVRATFNLIDDVVLSPSSSQSEGFSSGMELDFLSNGFKIKGSNNDISYSGQTHIYMAFAEAPFKFALAR